MRSYAGNRETAVETALESDSVAVAITSLVTDSGSFKGTMTELLERLTESVGERASSSKYWPTSPRSLATRVRRAGPLLRDIGIDVDFEHSGQRYVILEKVRRQPSRPSRPSRPSIAEVQPDDVDDVDGRERVFSGGGASRGAGSAASGLILLVEDPDDEVVV